MAAVSRELGPYWQALIALAAGAGLRQGELLGLAVGDVDFLRRVIHVRRQCKMLGGSMVFAPPKGGKTRDVPLADSVGMTLSSHLAAWPPVEVSLPWVTVDGPGHVVKLVFTVKGRAVRRDQFSRFWRPALERAGIKPRTATQRRAGTEGDDTGVHALRHYAASSWLAGGASIRDVAEYLGHSDPAFTLRIYSHLMPSSEERVRQATDEALAWCFLKPAATSGQEYG